MVFPKVSFLFNQLNYIQTYAGREDLGIGDVSEEEKMWP